MRFFVIKQITEWLVLIEVRIQTVTSVDRDHVVSGSQVFTAFKCQFS